MLIHLYDHTAVRFADTDRLAAHNKKALFIIYMEEGNAPAFMVYTGNMLIIRENGQILWIIAADRQAAQLLQ